MFMINFSFSCKLQSSWEVTHLSLTDKENLNWKSLTISQLTAPGICVAGQYMPESGSFFFTMSRTGKQLTRSTSALDTEYNALRRRMSRLRVQQGHLPVADGRCVFIFTEIPLPELSYYNVHLYWVSQKSIIWLTISWNARSCPTWHKTHS